MDGGVPRGRVLRIRMDQSVSGPPGPEPWRRGNPQPQRATLGLGSLWAPATSQAGSRWQEEAPRGMGICTVPGSPSPELSSSEALPPTVLTRSPSLHQLLPWSHFSCHPLGERITAWRPREAQLQFRKAEKRSTATVVHQARLCTVLSWRHAQAPGGCQTPTGQCPPGLP